MSSGVKKSPTHWLKAVDNLSTSFNLASRNIEPVLRLLLKSLIKELRAAALGVWTVEEKLNFMRIEASAGLNSEFLRYFNQTDRVRVGKGFVGRVMNGRKTLYSTNLQTKSRLTLSRWQVFFQEHGFQALVASPMFIGKKIVGAFVVYYKNKRLSFDQNELRFIEIIANQIAVTLENIKNYETIAKSKQNLQQEIEHILELQSVTESLAASSSRSVAKILELFFNYLKERFNIAGLSLLETDEIGKNLKVSLSLGLDPSQQKFIESRAMSLSRPTNLSTAAFQEQKIKVSPRALIDERIAKPWRTLLSIQGWPALAAAPMIIGEEKVGVMTVHYGNTHEFSKEEISIFDILAKYLGISLLNLKFIRTIVSDKEQMSSMINSLYDGLIVYELDGKISALNPRAEELLQIKSSEVIGKTAKDFDAAENPGSRAIKTISFLELAELESREVTISLDQEKIFMVTAVPLRQEGARRIGSMRVIHDITRESEIEGLHRDFVAIASHQLRTPLTGILWMLDGVLQGDFGKLSQDQKYYLQDGQRAAKRLMAMVNDLLLVSRLDIESSEYELSSINIYELISQIGSQMHKALSPEKQNIKWLVEAPKEKIPPIISDRKKLELAFSNIIDNAFSYTRAGGQVKASVRLERVLRKSIVISIKDTGIGIPKNDQKHLFVKFFRASNSTAMKPDGSGLGLFIANEIIKRLNGKIWVESKEGQGSTFYIMVPLRISVAK